MKLFDDAFGRLLKAIESKKDLSQQSQLLDPLLREKREEILRIAARHGATNVRVFGSMARGEADANSDVDFLVDLEKGRSLFDLGGLQMELQGTLKRPVDVATERGLRERIRERALKDVVAL